MRVVLVNPRTPGNIGASARACACFGVHDLWIVAPACDPLSGEAAKFATGPSIEVLRGARRAESLSQAIYDCACAIAFTRRTGELRARSLDFRGLGDRVAERGGAGIALVFGNEETGLVREDVERCTDICAIPTDPTMGSLNLSHAVSVALSQISLHRSDSAKSETKSPSRAPLPTLEGLFGHLEELLVDVGLRRGGNPERMMKRLRRVFHRAELDAREVRLLRGLTSKIQVALGTRVRGVRCR